MRTKKKVTTLINQEELPEQIRKFAAATSQIKAIEAEIELAHQEIVKKHEKKLANLNEVREETVANLQGFAEHNRDTLFSKKKSLELPHGTIGFRMGTHKVEKTNKKVTWEGIIEELKAIDEDFVRSVESVNKELIIATRENEETMAKLKSIGLAVVQDETFYVEAKAEELVTN